MPTDMPGLLASSAGTRLTQAEYERDFGARLWLADGADLWKLERRQYYDETGFPSWDAFAAGDWAAALRPPAHSPAAAAAPSGRPKGDAQLMHLRFQKLH